MSEISQVSQLLHLVFSANNRSPYDFRIALHSHSDRILNIICNTHAQGGGLTNEEIQIFLKYVLNILNDSKMYQHNKYHRLLRSIDDVLLVILDYYQPTSADIEIIIESKLMNSIDKLF